MIGELISLLEKIRYGLTRDEREKLQRYLLALMDGQPADNVNVEWLRVLEGPGIDVKNKRKVGLDGDRVLRYVVSGPVEEYATVGDALAAAVSGENILVPSGTWNADGVTVPAGVCLRGLGRETVLTGTVSVAGVLADVQVQGGVVGAASSGNTAAVLHCDVDNSAGDGIAQQGDGDMWVIDCHGKGSGYGLYVSGGGDVYDIGNVWDGGTADVGRGTGNTLALSAGVHVSEPGCNPYCEVSLPGLVNIPAGMWWVGCVLKNVVNSYGDASLRGCGSGGGAFNPPVALNKATICMANSFYDDSMQLVMTGDDVAAHFGLARDGELSLGAFGRFVGVFTCDASIWFQWGPDGAPVSFDYYSILYDPSPPSGAIYSAGSGLINGTGRDDIVPLWSAQAAWDTVNYETRHARDIDEGVLKRHLPGGVSGQRVQHDGNGWQAVNDDFLNLTDTPGTYGGAGGMGVAVNSGETGLEFVDVATQAELDAHTSRTDNPHGVTAAQAGAVDKTGDTMSGKLGIEIPQDSQYSLVALRNIKCGKIAAVPANMLQSATMICHYDGPQPYETDFSGDLTGHMGQVGTATGGVIFRPGRFGKAVQIAEATTNLVKNPSFENNVSNGWVIGANLTVTHVTGGMYGNHAARITGGTGVNSLDNRYRIIGISLTHGATYTISCYVRRVSGTGNLYFAVDSVNGKLLNINATSEFARYTATFSAVGSSMGFWLQNGADVFEIDAVQLEKKSYPTPYCDGSLGDGHSWSGTAHASTSSRTAGTVTYDNPLDTTAGTVALWWIPAADSVDMPTAAYLWSDGALSAYYNAGSVYLTDGTNTVSGTLSFSSGDNIWLAFTWDATTGTMRIWHNPTSSTPLASGTYTEPTAGATLYVGSDTAGANQANGHIDDLTVLSSALDADTIRAIYDCGVPVTDINMPYRTHNRIYTPSSMADTSGNVGDITWDENYIYVKTSAGWKRAALGTF